MKSLRALHPLFLKYKYSFLLGILFVAISNYFAVLPPAIIRKLLDGVQQKVLIYNSISNLSQQIAAEKAIAYWVLTNGLLLVGLAILRGFFMFLMRQTLIVMSRKIEFDQKNELYQHYQTLDVHFFKTNTIGDLMNRIAEDVARVRMYTGPALMYTVNLSVLGCMCIWGMWQVHPMLTLWVLLPFPFLAITLYLVNKKIYKKSEHIQAQLSNLTARAQETFAGIRIVKAFSQHSFLEKLFKSESKEYKNSALQLSMIESVYFPSMNLFIGLSMLFSVLVGGYLTIQGKTSAGHIAEFIMYINLLMFPISSIGWVASMIQRAAASQKRINDFLQTKSKITDTQLASEQLISGAINFDQVNFTYPHTGIQALHNFSLHIPTKSSIAILGKTGAGKSTLIQLLERMYEVEDGVLSIDGKSVKEIALKSIRSQIAYASQEPLLFSDTIYQNLLLANAKATKEEIEQVCKDACLYDEIISMPHQFNTIIGERGVLLSGGQKQRLGIARALLKKAPILVLDDCLSAVDTKTEQHIVHVLKEKAKHQTTIVITHRIFNNWDFDLVVFLDRGTIKEQGTHEALMQLKGAYYETFNYQNK
jgi:ATP-binding cassette, subfamily B, multidrug efflux pump